MTLNFADKPRQISPLFISVFFLKKIGILNIPAFSFYFILFFFIKGLERWACLLRLNNWTKVPTVCLGQVAPHPHRGFLKLETKGVSHSGHLSSRSKTKNPNLVPDCHLGRDPLSCIRALCSPAWQLSPYSWVSGGCFDGKPRKGCSGSFSELSLLPKASPELRSRGHLGSIASAVLQCTAGPVTLALQGVSFAVRTRLRLQVLSPEHYLLLCSSRRAESRPEL